MKGRLNDNFGLSAQWGWGWNEPGRLPGEVIA